MNDPADPFERLDKTVLRINPGGRRALPPDPAPVPNAPSPPPSAAVDEWFNPLPAAQLKPDERHKAFILKRNIPIAANENPLLEAAGPLLLLLGRLRTSLMQANVAHLVDQVSDFIEEFDKKTRVPGIEPSHADIAKYALCATCDDIVQHIPSEERHVWAQYSMLSRFFGERVGGVRFFEKLDQAKTNPVAHYHVLELIHVCLATGFQGKYRTSESHASLRIIQRDLYEILRKVRPLTKNDLSPHWRGQSLPSAAATFRIPFWILAALTAVMLFAVFMTFSLLLAGRTETVASEMARLFAQTPIVIERAQWPDQPVAPPAVPARRSTQLERIRARLADEIAAKTVDATENGNSIVIRIGDFALFASGEATVLESFRPLAVRIADTLDREPGDIRIVGHTDATKIKKSNLRFTSNYELSVERANAVASLLKPKLTDPARIKVEGKGDAVPIASNETAEGRARNRRVDLSIPREETR